jgi:membrane protease YdiL (CAAX protease family)
MSELDVFPSGDRPAPSKVHLTVCWILLVVVIVVILNRERIFARPAKNPTDGPAGQQPQAIAPIRFAGVEDMQAWILVGTQRLVPQQAQDVVAGAQSLDKGDPIRRLRYVALLHELLGPDAALEALGTLEAEVAKQPESLAEADLALFDSINALLRSYSEGDFTGAVLSEQARTRIEQLLQWPGRLLLHPAIPGQEDSPARQELLQKALRTMLVFTGIGSWILFGGFAGLVGLFVLFLLWKSGKLISRLGPPTGHGLIYLETFLLWLSIYFGASAGLPYLVDVGEDRLVWSALLMFASLVVLAWPIARGVSWRQVRGDIGLTWGDRPFMNVLSGVGAYFMMLPLAALGFLIFFSLLALKSRLMAAEPRIEDYAHPTLLDTLSSRPPMWQVYLLAAIAAPIVEEILFRGVLYRHLREATRCCCGSACSFLVSMVVNSVLFAIVHPQGLMAAPLLAALAFGLTIAREWRGSLVACILPHAINNFLIFTVAMTLFD